ncbi:MAG: NAD-dependent epimerase/dehydratase family protein [Burkholderiales bacterium]|nr:MAG: NAD-dependent epimerase/dehydratase family protein [Burkholderiales bacterium]
MRVLVTGASGFVGRAVLAELALRGCDTVAVSRRARTDLGLAECRVLSESENAGEVLALMRAVAPQVVLHLAGISSPENLAELYRTNVVFAAHLLDAALGMRSAPRVVLVGSAAEYGPVPAAQQPVSEDCICRPNTAYGISKLAQTQHALLARARGLPVVVGRLFNPIGAGMPKSLALGSFAHQIAGLYGGGGVLKTGDLDVVRDFMDVADAARLLVDLAFSAGPQEPEIVNVCTGQGHSLLDLTQRLIALSGKSIELQHDSARTGNSNVRSFVGSPGRLGRLGLQPAPFDADTVLRQILESAQTQAETDRREKVGK